MGPGLQWRPFCCCGFLPDYTAVASTEYASPQCITINLTASTLYFPVLLSPRPTLDSRSRQFYLYLVIALFRLSLLFQTFVFNHGRYVIKSTTLNAVGETETCP